MKSKVLLFIIILITATIFPGLAFAGSNYNSYILSQVERAVDSLLTPDDESVPTIADVESYKNTSDALNTLSAESDRVETEVRDEIKQAVDSAILQVKEEEPSVPAFQLQALIDDDRNEVLENVTQTVSTSDPRDVTKVTTLEVQVDQSLSIIENKIEDSTGVNVDISTQRQNIRDSLEDYSKTVRETNVAVSEGNTQGLFKDSDNDGVSDFDELNIYNTNPFNPNTAGGSSNDGQKILLGINPVNGLEITYEDITKNTTAHILDIYKVDSIDLMRNGDNTNLIFKGTALPNTYVTLYIYSTPVIVTIKANKSGEWEYVMDQELEDGKHNIYVATVDNSGKIVAKSSGIGFTKTAEAAVMGTTLNDLSQNESSLFKNNLLIIILAIVIGVMLITLMFIGQKSRRVETNLKDRGSEIAKL